MRHSFRCLRPAVLVVLLTLLLPSTRAQPALPSLTDPVILERITITDFGRNSVRLIGAEGAAAGSAVVAVRNLWTGETTSMETLENGGFAVQVPGTIFTPFRISHARSFSDEDLAADILPGVTTDLYRPLAASEQQVVFDTAGLLAYGAGRWQATGRINGTRLQAGGPFTLLFEARMTLPDAEVTLPYQMYGTLAFRPISDEAGNPLASIGAGWSSTLTAEGVPVQGGAVADRVIAFAQTDAMRPNTDLGTLSFDFIFADVVPANLPAGHYIPVFIGQASIEDSAPFLWSQNRILGVEGQRLDLPTEYLLPLVIQVGEPSPPRLAWQVLDTMSQESKARVVEPFRHQPRRSIRPPGVYSLEPIVPALHQNEYDVPAALRFEEGVGRLSVTVRRPDGRIDEISSPVVQTRRDGQGVYLTTFDERFRYDFDEYGTYQVSVDGFVEDVYGMRFEGGGTYIVTIAEPFTMIPSGLPGTPLRAGDILTPGLQLFPPFPADLRIDVQLPDAVAPVSLTGRANAYGGYSVNNRITARQAGIYRISYMATYRDSQGRLWAGEWESAGLIANSAERAQGVGGLSGYERLQQAWFDTRVYPADDNNILPIINAPRFVGDLAVLPDAANSGFVPALSTNGQILMSVVRPGLTMMQLFAAAEQALPTVRNDEQLDNQIGIGGDGLRNHDVVLLLGGTIFNEEIRGYAATVLIHGENARVIPALRESLQVSATDELSMLLLPTDLVPGQIVEVGTPLIPAGYVVPNLGAVIDLTLRAPDGRVQTWRAQANEFGYYTLPAVVTNGSVIDQAGVWQGTLRATYDGVTSAGLLDEPAYGAIAGVAETFQLYAVPSATPVLDTPMAMVTDAPLTRAFSIAMTVPAGWADVQLHYTVRTGSVVLDQGRRAVGTNFAQYEFDRTAIAQRFPQIEGNGSGPAASDEIFLTFALTGTDMEGVSVVRTRAFTLRHDQLYTLVSVQEGS